MEQMNQNSEWWIFFWKKIPIFFNKKNNQWIEQIQEVVFYSEDSKQTSTIKNNWTRKSFLKNKFEDQTKLSKKN